MSVFSRAAVRGDLSRDRFEMALRAGRMGTWRWDVPGGLVDWDGPMQELFGFAPGTFPGTYEAYASRLHPDDRAGQELGVAALLQNRGEELSVEHRVLLPDGTVRWIASTARLRLGSNGEPLELIGVSADITDRRAAEAERTALHAERDRAVNLLRRSLLPAELPTVPGLSVGAWYQPWTIGLDVGGDFYDVVPGGGHWWLALGDVCGKGTAAAVVGSSARYALRALLLDRTDPVAVLTRLNTVLNASEVDGDYLTVMLLRVTPATDPADPVRVRVRVATGGHPAPLLRRADGTVSPVEVRGTVLGLMADVRIGQSDLELRAGDAMLLYTDGLTDSTDASGRQLGEETARALVAGIPATGDAQSFVDTLAAGFMATAARIRDDVAVLGLIAE